MFQAKGDWCAAHGFPESFCPICKPNAPIPDIGTPTAPAGSCGGKGLPESEPESKGTKCNPELIRQFKAAGDWCEEHGFPKSACPACNPQTPPAQASATDWCLEHGLPESQCTQCHPELIPQFKAAGDFCEEHGFPESACPVCNPREPPAGAEKAAIEARVVRFKSPEIEKTAGLGTAMAHRAAAATSVECTARIAFDGDRVADVRAIVPGVVRRVRAELGAGVRRGAPLFELESTRVGEIQGALQTSRERARTAKANLDRQRGLRESDIASARQVELAEQELTTAQAEARAAEAALRMAGAARADPSGRYTLTAPITGTIIRRPAVVGVLATESTSLATVGDTSVMWALCDVPELDAPRIALGQRMTVHIAGSSQEEPIQGRITWIAAEVDPRTRTVTARAEVKNPDGRLRANQFARAQIETSARRAAVSVPRAAVQRVGDLEVVFVRVHAGTYEPRVVRRSGDGDLVQVEGRVREGEAVVTTGAVLLRTEVMPGSIGAGCCEVE
ncbi:MAG: efflux RND transporter periplasmic adaptor subunit [Deltaproteobacteria bacterium]|nr:efflux RND transporter periplasmic adaptor subunit [Deltaproteobacteria bacterium]